ncbi:MAG: UDP-3-O-[3-hydroxymyristoyl] N-acetylglucosamine deacetylase [Lentisphaerae bacterium GWF2_44_16]|nr:MAG: UDP-3-O-[3-hydroxymyristoyl] N-acetylglucosamine deacetylase [Lentisphaerae bacterium GWF2_44_16]
MAKQKTLKNSVFLSGIALHTGARAKLNLSPAPENTGIVFKRIDLPGSPEVKASAANVVDVRRGTTIASGNARVYTVEHVLASLHAAEVDNAIVEMDGLEPPIADGSAEPYTQMIIDAGTVEQSADAKYWTASSPIIVEEGDTKMVLLPYDKFKITCIVSYGASPLDTQYFSGEITTESFAAELAPSRTFCLYKELEQLLALGLVKGGSLDSAAVIHNGAIICKEGLRYQNELARHKTLDIVGDMYLVGRRVKAHIIAVKPGHPINIRLANEMLKQSL